jgi:hypothetical protein
LVFIWGFVSIGGIDFCEVTKGCVLEMEAIGLYLGEFEPIGGIDFCEVTREDVLEMEAIGV